MPEAGVRAICPYLRGRGQQTRQLHPSDDNHCLVTASIHLPHSQQSRFCLGGHYESCRRYIAQKDRPLPLYVTGVRPKSVQMTPPPPPLRVRFWRRPWFRLLLRLVVLALLVMVVFWGWRWQQDLVPRRELVRPPMPTAIPAPTQQPARIFLAPTYSAPASKIER